MLSCPRKNSNQMRASKWEKGIRLSVPTKPFSPLKEKKKKEEKKKEKKLPYGNQTDLFPFNYSNEANSKLRDNYPLPLNTLWLVESPIIHANLIKQLPQTP